MGNKSSSKPDNAILEADNGTARPEITTCVKSRKPVYKIEELLALLKETMALHKLAVSLLNIIAKYAEELAELLPEIKEPITYYAKGAAPVHDMLIKLIMCGDTRTGKSPLLHRFVTNEIAKSAASTIGVDFSIITFAIGATKIKAQIWDTAGQERFRAITRSYYRGASAVAVVFDIGTRSSFEHVQKLWLKEAREHGENVSIILIGHNYQYDVVQKPREVTKEEATDYAMSEDIDYCECDLQDLESVRTAFISVFYRVLQRVKDGKLQSLLPHVMNAKEGIK